MPRTPWPRTAATDLVSVVARLCLLGALVGGAQAAPPLAENVWMAVGDQTLDSLRGGFRMGEGLLVSFGITRAVYINGALMTETTLQVGRMADITPAQATQLSQQLETISLVQNGPGNSFAPGSSPNPGTPSGAGPTITSVAGGMAGTIIQNSLNNQHISNQTIVNAHSNGLGMVRSLNLYGTLNDAIQHSVGQR